MSKLDKMMAGTDMTAAGLSDERPEDEKRRDAETVKTWAAELDQAKRREKDWKREAKKAVEIYESLKDKASVPYNILYTNTETLSAAVYSATPRPNAVRRFEDDDPVGLVGCDVLNRASQYYWDTNDGECDDFSDQVKEAVLGALVPGRGVLWYRYEAKFEEKERAEPVNDESDSEEVPEGEIAKVEDEYLESEVVDWDQFLHGYARRWSQVPWVARLHKMSKVELVDNYGEVLGNALPLTKADENVDGKPASNVRRSEKDSVPATCDVWEIWDKTSRKVYHIVETWHMPLKQVEDPLELTGFFPCARPLKFTRRVGDLSPTALYQYYEQQAMELNRVTTRLKLLIAGMRIRGMYSSEIESIADVLEAEDNRMIALGNSAIMEGAGLDKAIWLVPIEKYPAVIQELSEQRDQIKAVIYDITSIADIMRASNDPQESAESTRSKNHWGTMRLKQMQKEVQRFCRDCLRIQCEIMGKHFSQEKFAKITGLEIPTKEQQDRAKKAVEEFQKQQAEQQAIQDSQRIDQQRTLQGLPEVPGQLAPHDPLPQQGPTPQAPPPPPPPELQQAQQIINQPNWEDVLELIKDDQHRLFRINIETDSTIAEDMLQDQEDIVKLMTGISQMLQSFGPLIQMNAMPFPAFKQLMISVMRRFRLGDQVEKAFQAMQPPPPPAPPQPSPKDQIDLQIAQLSLKSAQVESQSRIQEASLKGQSAAAKHQLEMQANVQAQQQSAQEHAQNMQALDLKGQLTAAQTLGKLHQQTLKNKEWELKIMEGKQGAKD